MSSIVKHAPRFSNEDASCIARDLFGVEAAAKPLPSERDQNFRLASTTGEAFVLKIANGSESFEVLDFQNRVMMHIADRKDKQGRGRMAFPEARPGLDGKTIRSVTDENGARYYTRLLTWLPGKPLAEVKPHDPALMRDLGRFFGNLDRALETFDHPAAHRDFHWDLKNAGPVIGEYIDLIEHAGRRDMVRRLLTRFRTRIEPRMTDLHASVVHNDGNDYNVLVEPDGEWGLRVSGVIDLGDMVHTPSICEPAIVCAYAMMNKADPLATARDIVAGYHEARPLAEEESAVLFDLIRMRLCMSVCHCANQKRLEPDNEYLRISEKPAWRLLEKLDRIHPRFAHYVFRRAAGLPPVPGSGKIVSWLKKKSGKFNEILTTDLTEKNVHVLDMGLGSHLPGLDWSPDDPASIAPRIRREIREAGAKVGLTPHGEARLFPPGGAYDFRNGRMPEQKSIHLGVDIYTGSNAPIFAFMDGKIHGFGNDATRHGHGPTIVLEHETDDGGRFYTLYGRLNPISLENATPGDIVRKGERFAWTGNPGVNGGRPPHLHFQLILDMLDESGDFPGSAEPGMADVWTGVCPDPNLILGLPERCFPAPGRSHGELLALRRAKLGRNLVVSYDRPLKIVRGVGQYLFTDQGQVYLDGNNNVSHVGHCHPRVVRAGRSQMAVLNTNTRYLHDNIVEYSRRLLATFPAPLGVCFFVCTGSEANELAIRMARTYTGREDIITLAGAYHGNTRTLIDVSPYKYEGPGGLGAPPWVHKVPMPDGYRGPHKGMSASTGARWAEYVRDAANEIRSRGPGPAGFICESVLGCGGQVVLPDNYLKEAFRHVRAAGGACIVDEVQVGFGRVGSHYWGFETQGVTPDIVTLGKPMGNGHPLAAVITTPEIADAFANGMEYFNTFGGNPVSCAIGQAVLDVIEDEGLMDNALEAGARLREGLKGLMDRRPLIGDVRGLGLFVGVELVVDRETLAPAPGHASHIANRMKDRGVLISTDGPLHNVLKIKPPLVFSEKNADELVEALDKVLEENRLQV